MTIASPATDRRWPSAMWRGFQSRCPACNKGQLFTSYLKITPVCSHCQTEYFHHRADDAPPYLTIVIVGHLVVPLLVLFEKFYHPELWTHFAIWLPATLIVTLWLLPRIKGAIIGLQWANRMHGFSGGTGET